MESEADQLTNESIQAVEKDLSNVKTCCQWKPTSSNHLVEAETKMLEHVKAQLEKKFVELPDGNKLWTVIANNGVSNKIPLVMVHGFAGGVGLWALNYDSLCKNRTVYTFDLLGFGKSSRPKFDVLPEKVEKTFVESIEEWRKAMEIDQMLLLGHSFGGYLVSSYAMKYPDNVKKLLLIDPWGYNPAPPNFNRFPIWIRAIARILGRFNPLAAVRAAGPLGPKIIRRVRSDFKSRYPEVTAKDKNAVLEYIYHCNAGSPSGETAFKRMTEKMAFAYKPMVTRIHALHSNIPVTFVYGANSWMDRSYGYETQTILEDNQVQVWSVNGAGHHVYADRPAQFHEIINAACHEVNQ